MLDDKSSLLHVSGLVLAILNACAQQATDTQPFVVESPSPVVAGSSNLRENVGLETLGGVFTPLLPQGCSIPCHQSFVFSSAADDQPKIELRLFRGLGETTNAAHALGVFEVTGFAPMPAGEPKVEVSFTASSRGIELAAVDLHTGRHLRISRQQHP